ncbi:UdgX family uracil-DNA binding protein [Streptomyces montanisoli]|uniref:Type-4 uracil-DNA glycosylase n=1 Tax=Streptomyces montanisoli TaxID=2798581 RepID=A0A940MKT5_9ACTN|nr:UdgX family uracil-DNA binding protein [Streptomyces montanisoli]MBP0461981.1 UdgX family uracil-DNA binding protein [Streptomyces montanisoli]
MAETHDARAFLPRRGGIPAHRKAAAECRGCALHEHATQTVFGEGKASARLMLVGEEPGDREDTEGEPFVGPAGGLLRRAARDAGLDMKSAYVTNAVKHFKFEQAGPGKRRIHKPPSLREMTACRPWLEAELRIVAPEVVVALGATAAKSLLGHDFRVSHHRGEPLTAPVGTDATVVATLHPSAVLRSDNREQAYEGLVADLKVAGGLLHET